MSKTIPLPKKGEKSKLKLVPRLKDQGYAAEDVAQRRAWLAKETGVQLDHIAACTIDSEAMRGNIENPVGSVQMPLGIAGPLKVNGDHAKGTYYLPMATTEGALVRSYERGMVALTRAGGVSVHVVQDENRIAPTFFFEDVAEAAAFCREVPLWFEEIRRHCDATTNHGKLLRIEPHPVGRQVILNFCFYTGDAQGMNMISRAAEAGCNYIQTRSTASHYNIFSGMSLEKRAGGFLLQGGKGKKVVAGCKLPAKLVRTYLHCAPETLRELWEQTVKGHLNAQAVGFNAHLANGLTAFYIACGQDVANVVNAATGITHLECTAEGDLYASLVLPSLTLATVGGGVDLGTNKECLQMLDCYGSGKAQKLAEITAAALLGGELSFSAAIASGEFVNAHETYGRNRPKSE